jgi:cysteine desulfuration protein SufE
VIELGRALEPLSGSERNDATRVRGCVSQVWLVSETRENQPGSLFFRGDSDAHLVRGEIALLLRIFSSRSPAEILSIDPRAVFEQLGLKDALTAQRSNGLFAMMSRIQQAARAAAT